MFGQDSQRGLIKVNIIGLGNRGFIIMRWSVDLDTNRVKCYVIKFQGS